LLALPAQAQERTAALHDVADMLEMEETMNLSLAELYVLLDCAAASLRFAGEPFRYSADTRCDVHNRIVGRMHEDGTVKVVVGKIQAAITQKCREES
jgi:hypothetical protein